MTRNPDARRAASGSSSSIIRRTSTAWGQARASASASVPPRGRSASAECKRSEKAILLFHQFVVGSGLHELSLVENVDAVGVANRLQPMRDADAREARFCEMHHHALLGVGIERTGCLIEH